MLAAGDKNGIPNRIRALKCKTGKVREKPLNLHIEIVLQSQINRLPQGNGTRVDDITSRRWPVGVDHGNPNHGSAIGLDGRSGRRGDWDARLSSCHPDSGTDSKDAYDSSDLHGTPRLLYLDRFVKSAIHSE